MSEPTPAVLHVTPTCAPWDVAVDAVCASLETYAAWRLHSGDIPTCAHVAQISPATAARFERTLDAISDTDDDPDDSAAPGHARPGAAEHSE